jgi:V/A-type H+-transporting ATPase subunit I
VLENPRLFRPFEAIVRMFPAPSYGTIDPTPFVAVFFPMFFGVILGDVAYGLALALVAGILHLRSRPGTTLRSISEIAGACAAFTIAFGFVYGEALGDLGRQRLGLRPLVFDREEALIPFFAFTLALGAVHMLLGLLIGASNTLRTHPRQSLGRGISAILILLIATAILAAARVLPAVFFTPSVIAILVAFPILIVVEGVLAPIELLSTLGNILSYARIMALGTASVVMAVVANRMVGATGSIVVGILFGLLFHLVNFALGIFGPTIHALRLHYVEFFGKFYSAGGVEYRPFGHWRPDGNSTP